MKENTNRVFFIFILGHECFLHGAVGDDWCRLTNCGKIFSRTYGEGHSHET